MLAYIGPGPGLAVQAPALLLVWALLVALGSLLLLPLRWLLRRPKRRTNQRWRRVVVVGLDGLEPTLVEEGMRDGRLPAFQALAAEGGYQRLGTTCPPLSPVAWSTFATGVNPGRHGVFDFVHRTPDLQLKLGFNEVVEEPLRWWGWKLPWKRARARQLRKGISFWEILGQYGVFSQILRVPVTWPSPPFFGTLLSAMGVPDLRGSQGTYTLFGRHPEALQEGEWVAWREQGEVLTADFRLSSGNLLLRLARQGTAWELSWKGGRQALQPGQYSPWVRLPFGRASGLVRFLLLDESPRLYATPVQIDPSRPALSLSHPHWFSLTLAKLLGPYATCGLAEDTGAREDGILSEKQFVEQCYEIHEERERQFFHLLDRTPDGLCAVVFDGSDRIQHMALQSPAAMENLYARMDDLVARVRARLSAQDLLLVLSDHGFKAFLRQVDVNAWLLQKGYLSLDPEGKICWERTRVVALGLAGLHLNLKGRQPKGIVEPEQAEALKQNLRKELLDWVDPQTGERPLVEIYDSQHCYQGPYRSEAADLILGWEVGYRIAKSAARGEVGEEPLRDNDSRWCGDHCLHPLRVPGILFANQRLATGAHLRDLAPTILDAFGVPRPAFLEGRSLCLD